MTKTYVVELEYGDLSGRRSLWETNVAAEDSAAANREARERFAAAKPDCFIWGAHSYRKDAR